MDLESMITQLLDDKKDGTRGSYMKADFGREAV